MAIRLSAGRDGKRCSASARRADSRAHPAGRRDAGHGQGTDLMDPTAAWHTLLREDHELGRQFCLDFAAAMRARRLTFGDRIHCPFLRPFFLSPADETRIRRAAETLAAVGERVVTEAMRSPALFAQLGVTAAEERLVR